MFQKQSAKSNALHTIIQTRNSVLEEFLRFFQGAIHNQSNTPVEICAGMLVNQISPGLRPAQGMLSQESLLVTQELI